MGCNCSLVQTTLYVVIAVLAFWPDLIGPSSTVIGVAALLLLLHHYMCKGCDVSGMKKKK
jgi:hypothetical protein